tara:strand:+ start:70 stop:423 length:354 start_codon:yes stop_codon:yes gene_type:complete
MSNQWIPEFCYEEDDSGVTSNLPFVPVPKDEKMPEIIYVFESRQTGEFEPGPEGEDLPVTEMELHQYCDMGILKERLSFVEYDNIRYTLGLEPLANAAQKGKQITDNVRRTMVKEDE